MNGKPAIAIVFVIALVSSLLAFNSPKIIRPFTERTEDIGERSDEDFVSGYSRRMGYYVALSSAIAVLWSGLSSFICFQLRKHSSNGVKPTIALVLNSALGVIYLLILLLILAMGNWQGDIKASLTAGVLIFLSGLMPCGLMAFTNKNVAEVY